MLSNDNGHETLAKFLNELGYKAKYDSEEDYVESAMAGLKVLVYWYESGSIQLFCGIKMGEDSGFGATEVNAFNKSYRFAKVYMTDEGDLAIENDALIDWSRESAFSNLQKIIGLWEGSLSLLKEAMADAKAHQHQLATPVD